MASSFFTKMFLSESIDGRPIRVITTAVSGQLIHTAVAVSGSVAIDEITMFACNNGSVDCQLAIKFGGLNDADLIFVTVPFQAGLMRVLPGLCLNNSSEVRVYATYDNCINVSGYVNRIT